MLWCNKVYFIQEAIAQNPFQSDYFVWTDIGCIRDQKTLQFAKTFPDGIPSLISMDECLFSLVEPQQFQINDSKTILVQHDVPMQYYPYARTNFNAIQGGFFACSKQSISKLLKEYEITLHDFISLDRFAGKDQYIFNTLVSKHLDFIKLLPPRSNPVDNNWFSFLYWCSQDAQVQTSN